MKNNDSNLYAHAALFGVNVVFGINLTITKSVLSFDYITPLGLNFCRVFGAAILFWLTSLFFPKEKVTVKDMGLIFLASLFGVQLNQLLFLIGIQMTSPVDASIIATATPIITMIIAAFYLREPITWKKGLGVAIGALGAIMLIVGTSRGHVQASSSLGNMLCLVSGALYATYLVFFKSLISRYSPVTFMKWMFTFSAICASTYCTKDFMAIDFAALPSQFIIKVLFVVCCATFLTYMFIPVGQKHLRPTIVGMYNYIQPLVASVIAVVVGMDSFGWHKALAAFMVFFGVWLVTRSKSRAQIEKNKNNPVAHQ